MDSCRGSPSPIPPGPDGWIRRGSSRSDGRFAVRSVGAVASPAAGRSHETRGVTEMASKEPRVPSEKPEIPAKSRRFRIEKLEERIAPKKGGRGTHNCPISNGCY